MIREVGQQGGGEQVLLSVKIQCSEGTKASELTLDKQMDRVAGVSPLGVGGGTGVGARVMPLHSPHSQTQP